MHVNASSGGVFMLTRTYSSTNADLGYIQFGNLNWDSNLAEIKATQDNSNTAAFLSFRTQPDGGSTTERLRIGSRGELQLGGTSNAGFIDFDSTSLQLNTQRNPNTGAFVNTSRAHAGITLTGQDGSSLIKFFTASGNNTTGTQRMVINHSGYVGVGVTQPQDYYSKNLVVMADGDGTGGITIAAPATNDTTYLCFADGTSGSQTYRGYVAYSHNVDALIFGAGAGTRVEINSTRMQVDIPIRAIDGGNTTPAYSFSGDTDTGLFRAGSGQLSVAANGTHAMTFRNYGIDMTMNSNAYVDLNRSGFITFYGNASGYHGIGSRNASGSADDDIRINSFGGVFINLDSNNNDTSDTHNSFFIGRHGAATATIDQLLRVHGDTGDLTTEGNVTAYGSTSDIRLKENIEVIPNALDKVQKLRGITFNYKKDGSRSTGLIAQELEEVLPEVVYTETELDGENEHLAVRYGNTVGLLVEAIKEQQQQIETLKQTIEEMKNGSHKNK
jgi:hypothetical protein